MNKGELIGKIFWVALVFVLIGSMLSGLPALVSKVEASPGTIYVPDDYPTIQDAVNAASAGDTIIVYPGTYIIENTLTILQDINLTLKPGGVIRFKDGYSGVIVQGTLKAVGTEDEKIVFTSYRDDEYGGSGNPAPGDWKQIYFSPTSTDSELINTIIKYGGSFPSFDPSCPWQMAAIRVDQSSIIFKNSILEQNRGKGLYLMDSPSIIDNVQFLWHQVGCGSGSAIALLMQGGSPTINNSTFKNNTFGIYLMSGGSPVVDNNIFEENGTPIYVQNSHASFRNNQTPGNTNNLNGILIFDTGINQDTIWQADLPYIIEGTLTISQDVVFTLNPGVVIKFRDGYSGITVHGTLKAIGGETEDKRIVFTSYGDDEYGGSGASPGSWKQIYFSPTSTDSELINVIVSYGGSFPSYEVPCHYLMAAIRVDQSLITLKDSIIEQNRGKGVYLINSSSIIDNVQFFNNTPCQGYFGQYGGTGISIEGGSPTVENSTFGGNVFGIEIRSGASGNSCIYLGNFIDNGDNVYSYDSINTWNSPEEITYTYNGDTYTNYLGNYWDDYTGSDANGDGIGDTPYAIDGDSDNYPLVEPFENYAAAGKVWGRILRDGQPAPNEMVVLFDHSSVPYRETITYTNQDGIYEFSGLHEGDYDLNHDAYRQGSPIVEGIGYFQTKPVTISPSNPVHHYQDIDLSFSILSPLDKDEFYISPSEPAIFAWSSYPLATSCMVAFGDSNRYYVGHLESTSYTQSICYGSYIDKSDSITPFAPGEYYWHIFITPQSTCDFNDIESTLRQFRILGPDTIPPTVSSVSPEDGDTDVPTGTVVTATFSEAMDSSVINTSSFTLAGSAVSGTVTYDPATYTATFTPDGNLEFNHTYTATLSTAITDLAGNPLAEPYTWNFTTESWSFAIITDLHIGRGFDDYGTPGHDDELIGGQKNCLMDRLVDVVNWINSNYEEENIKFLVILGDISDTAERSEFLKAKEILDDLQIPYVPLIGNHDTFSYTTTEDGEKINLTDEGDSYFEEVFWNSPGENLGRLVELFGASWEKQLPYHRFFPPKDFYFQNYAFSYKGINFICLDYARRDFNWMALVAQPFSQTNDWLADHLQKYSEKPVIVFSHYPYINLGGVNLWEQEYFTLLVNIYNKDKVLTFGGHIHAVHNSVNYNVNETFHTDSIPVIVTKALMEPPRDFLRIVRVEGRDIENIHYDEIETPTEVQVPDEPSPNLSIPTPPLSDLLDWLAVKVESPVELRVYDSQGRITGSVNGEVRNEIPKSCYSDGSVTILASTDSYRYEVAGIDEGSYGLGVTSVEDGEANTFTAADIPTAPGAVHQYTIDWGALSEGEQGVTVQVDSDGDGEFENTFTSDNELTRREFVVETTPPVPPMVPTMDKYGIVAMITLFAGLLVWMVRRRPLAS